MNNVLMLISITICIIFVLAIGFGVMNGHLDPKKVMKMILATIKGFLVVLVILALLKYLIV